MAQTAAGSIERKRKLAAARQARRRAKLATDGAASKNAAPQHDVAARIQPAGSPTRPISPPRVHATQKLESIGSTPEEFTGVPPATDAPPAMAAVPTPDDVAGAKAFGFALGWMVNFALTDAMTRYGFDSVLAGAGAEGMPVGLNPETVPAAAAAFVAASAERVALKYGFGLRIPYQDELVTVGAGAASGVYLLRKFTGRLPKPGERKVDEPKHDQVADDAGAETDDVYGRINLDNVPRR